MPGTSVILKRTSPDSSCGESCWYMSFDMQIFRRLERAVCLAVAYDGLGQFGRKSNAVVSTSVDHDLRRGLIETEGKSQGWQRGKTARCGKYKADRSFHPLILLKKDVASETVFLQKDGTEAVVYLLLIEGEIFSAIFRKPLNQLLIFFSP